MTCVLVGSGNEVLPIASLSEGSEGIMYELW